jgi:hypothetical protein
MADFVEKVLCGAHAYFLKAIGAVGAIRHYFRLFQQCRPEADF